ncbi:MAG: arsenate reductase (azurin) large subunit [Chlorobium phaeobacteroides]|nr:arsenate reductase (azurin) large subunit [Chlorobium phaeobacteroides]
MSLFDRKDTLPIPPKDAEKYTTVCQYCSAGCGYNVYVWPENNNGSAKSNAFNEDLSKQGQVMSGFSYTETMHNVITRNNGKKYHLAIIPAKESRINKGDYSIRGGTNALTAYNENGYTKKRLKDPLIRRDNGFVAITWDDAVEIIASLVKASMDSYGSDSIAMKFYDHGSSGMGFEDNWAAGKLFLSGIKTQYLSIHNRPAYNSETWGTRERGMHELNYDVDDARLADTIVLWGANAYESGTILYTEHIMPNLQGGSIDEKESAFEAGEPAEEGRIIIVDPRKNATVTISQDIDPDRVLHIRPNLGTDWILANAIARIVWENKWYDNDYLQKRTDMKTFEEYKLKSLQTGKPLSAVLSEAEQITGVSRNDMEKAASWIASPKEGNFKRRTLTIFEKGIIWNMKNYDQVAAIAQLNVLSHNVGRPGTGCGRLGGHQEGYVRPPAPTPGSIYAGGPPKNVDKYLTGGGGKMFWVGGTDPYLGTPNSQFFKKSIKKRSTELLDYLDNGGVPSSPAEYSAKVLEAFEQTGGLFMIVQDIYMTHTAQDAMMILPAAGWGEAVDTSINCHSRLLRIYDKFMDAPGEALPDWKILALVGIKLKKLYEAEGNTEMAERFSGMEWQNDAEVFAAGAEEFGDNKVSEKEEAGLSPECYKGVTHDMLRKLGNEGIQTPVRQDPATGKLVGTKRRYKYSFATKDGLFKWYGTDPWTGYPKEVAKYLDNPKYPFWFTTGRSQQVWQTMYHDRRIPEKYLSLPLPYVEIHPDDAAKLGTTSGDMVEVYNEEGTSVALVYVNDSPKPGLVFGIMYHAKGTMNNLISSYTDPKTTIPWYKGTKVGIRKYAGKPDDAIKTASLLPNNDVT